MPAVARSSGHFSIELAPAQSDAMAAIARLSWSDLNNLAIEAPDTPMHQGVLATVDRAPLLDIRGELRVAEIRAHLAARIELAPELRRVLHRPGFLRGRPIWIDDPSFRIENHVLTATLSAPGGEPAAMEFAAQQMALLMDRSRPLWQLWVLDGYSPDRVGMLIKLHHALADGPAMINLLARVFDLEPHPPELWTGGSSPEATPSNKELLRDSLRLKASALKRGLQRLGHPAAETRTATSMLAAMAEEVRRGRGAPRTSLNRPITNRRQMAAMRLPLADVKATAHDRNVKLNDVFLCLVAAGLRRVLIARGEPVLGLSVRASVAVSLQRANQSMSGNHVGTMVVPIPVDIERPDQLLAVVAAETARAKSRQLPVASNGLMVFLAQTGISRAFIRHQHIVNILTTNLPGPPVPLYFAGARVHNPVAMPPIAGNVTVSFAALSYDGGLTLSVVTDASAWHELDLLMSAMRDCWLELNAVTRVAA